MKIEKFVWSKIFVAFFLFEFLFIGVAAAQQYKFRIGHVVDIKHSQHIGLTHFAEAVEKETDGRVKITIIPSSGLGSLVEMADQLKLGALEMMLFNTTVLAQIEPKFVFDMMPYLWKDLDQIYYALHRDLGKVYADECYKQGYKILCFSPVGFRNMTNNVRPIYKVEDLKGLKLRVLQSKIPIESFKLLGVSPVPMAFGELYTALQLKTVDGQENPVSLIYSSKFYEVQKYLSITNHMVTINGFVFSRPLWEKLPKDIQIILQKKAVEVAEKETIALFKKDESIAIDLLKEKGMQVNNADINDFKKAVRPLYKTYAPIIGPEIVEILKKYAGAEF